MISEKLRARMAKDRPRTTITMRIPVDVVELMKEIAPTRGFTGYQTLLKFYISEGLRRDEAQTEIQTLRRLTEVLKKRGVKESLLKEALAEARGQLAADEALIPARPRPRQPAPATGLSANGKSPKAKT
jgi:hypothetical protein